ncbi:MAG: isochorismatase family protein [Candidatus Latescibacteria bacterium]|nr:isochorismatase family protein [Candidatus Latescibacterota bacterium]
MGTDSLKLALQRQELVQTDGYHIWESKQKHVEIPTNEAALLVCDVWDNHWCRGARERLNAMVTRMNQVVQASRANGLQIIHAPSGTMEYYDDTPSRQRILKITPVLPPENLEHPDPPLPIDDSDQGSDTGEASPVAAWRQQHGSIEIDHQCDVISDDGREVYSLLKNRGIDKLLIMGVHTNMCVLERSFAIKQMVRWGIHVALIRDLTDTMYNPAMPPYVDHAEGTKLVIGYIEKFWCPTIESQELLNPA